MTREYYLDLAAQGLRMPIGTDLVLHEKSDPKAIVQDGTRLGQVVLDAADRFHTPLAFALMDLMLEKAALLEMLGISESADTYHFSSCPTDAMLAQFQTQMQAPLPPRMQASCAALRHVVKAGPKYLPIGMSIGPVSLMTKLLADPITPIYIAGTGTTAAEDDEVRTLECVLAMATSMVLRSVTAQIQAGAKAICIAEPTANLAFFSPKQLSGAASVWERYVMANNRRIKALLDAHGVDLIFHCCGELVDSMVEDFCTLRPVILSLGASRKLWEDARIVPKDIVLYGNLPTKKFYSDDVISPQQVTDLTRQLLTNMRRAGHPFILGSECDVLSVPGCEATILRKVELMLTCNV
ncbi:MAG: uroporphyrinogen decarboxylase family protein [Phycisphaerae bacterium]